MTCILHTHVCIDTHIYIRFAHITWGSESSRYVLGIVCVGGPGGGGGPCSSDTNSMLVRICSRKVKSNTL